MTKWIGDRISIEDFEQTTTIVIRPLRSKIKEFFLLIWVLGFTFVGFTMLYLLFTDFAGLNYNDVITAEDKDSQFIYGIVFMGFWFYFEYKTVKALLWYRFGKELIKIDNDALFLKKSILTYGKANRYFFENIKNFHQRKFEEGSFGGFFENAYWALGTDELVFQYQGKTKSFGRRLDEKSGRLLLRLIDDRVRRKLKKN